MKPKTFKQAQDYIESLIPTSNAQRFQRKIGIQRLKYILQKLGNPQNDFISIHIAGTSGKGSTAYLLTKLLWEHGFKAGLHLSPHLQSVRERIVVNNNLISPPEFISIIAQLKPFIELAQREFEAPVTYFECLLAACFLHFKNMGVKFAVVETGIGGTYDGTNLLKSSVSVITRIGLDHTNILGSTIGTIAQQKTGIIKRTNVAVISQKQLPIAMKIIRNEAQKKKVSLKIAGENFKYNISSRNKTGSVFTYEDEKNNYKNLHLSLLGDHQVENAACALQALNQLKSYGLIPVPVKIRHVFSHANFPGRMEILSYPQKRRSVQERLWMLDGAHNPDKFKALSRALNLYGYDKTRKIGVIAFKKGKDINKSLKPIKDIFETIIFTRAKVLTSILGNVAVPTDILISEASKIGFQGRLYSTETVDEALIVAQKVSARKDLIVATGSLYLVGEVRDKLGIKYFF